MIGETGERKSAVATPDGKSRKKKKKKLELSSWWFVDRSYGDTANVDGEYLNVVVLGN